MISWLRMISDGARVFCDGNMPSFNPINYNPEELQYEQPPPKPPVVRPPETPAPPEVPKDAVPKVEEKAEPPCPGPNALRVGDVAQNQKERVSGYELQTVNGELVCVTLWEDIPIVAQYLPTSTKLPQQLLPLLLLLHLLLYWQNHWQTYYLKYSNL